MRRYHSNFSLPSNARPQGSFTGIRKSPPGIKIILPIIFSLPLWNIRVPSHLNSAPVKRSPASNFSRIAYVALRLCKGCCYWWWWLVIYVHWTVITSNEDDKQHDWWTMCMFRSSAWYAALQQLGVRFTTTPATVPLCPVVCLHVTWFTAALHLRQVAPAHRAPVSLQYTSNVSPSLDVCKRPTNIINAYYFMQWLTKVGQNVKLKLLQIVASVWLLHIFTGNCMNVLNTVYDNWSLSFSVH